MLTPTKKSAHRDFTFSKGCASIHSGAEITIDTAGNLPDSEAFSRSEFKVLDVGIAYPQGRQHGCIHVFGPASILIVRKAKRMVFSLIQELKP